jgi:hypothetical protein
MEQILVTVKDKRKARILSEFLQTIDFVESVDANGEIAARLNAPQYAETGDFFALAGLWEGREINLKSIRQQAWPRQQQ